jgi:hypothetical protein
MRSFDAALRTALDFISNPHKLWSSGRLCDRHAVLKLAFPGGFTGLRTDESLLPFKVLGGISSKQFQMAGESHSHFTVKWLLFLILSSSHLSNYHVCYHGYIFDT